MSTDQPTPGFYKTKMVKGGPWVPARVWDNVTPRDEAGDYLDDQCMMMEIDGKRVSGQSMDSKWLWMMGNPIPKSEYDWMMADLEHAKNYRPDDPKARPTKAIDLANAKPIF